MQCQRRRCGTRRSWTVDAAATATGAFIGLDLLRMRQKFDCGSLPTQFNSCSKVARRALDLTNQNISTTRRQTKSKRLRCHSVSLASRSVDATPEGPPVQSVFSVRRGRRPIALLVEPRGRGTFRTTVWKMSPAAGISFHLLTLHVSIWPITWTKVVTVKCLLKKMWYYCEVILYSPADTKNVCKLLSSPRLIDGCVAFIQLLMSVARISE